MGKFNITRYFLVFGILWVQIKEKFYLYMEILENQQLMKSSHILGDFLFFEEVQRE